MNAPISIEIEPTDDIEVVLCTVDYDLFMRCHERLSIIDLFITSTTDLSVQVNGRPEIVESSLRRMIRATNRMERDI